MTEKDNNSICPHREQTALWALASPAQRDPALADHLSDCPDCRAEAAALQATVTAIRTSRKATPPPELAASIMRAVHHDQSALRRRNTFFLRCAAAALLVIALGIWLQHSGYALRCAPPSPASTASFASQRVTAADWLARQQQPDGTWLPSLSGGNDAYRPALTALAILALQQQAPDTYSHAIQNGITALIDMQNSDGSFHSLPSARAYNHAFATYALFTTQANGESHKITTARENALAYALITQNYQGAWDYQSDGSGNTALTTWQLAGLLKARQSGWRDDQGHLRRGLAWLRRQQNGVGFGYRQPGIPLLGTTGLTLSAMATTALLEAAQLYPEIRPAAENAFAKVKELYSREHGMKPDYYRDYFLARLSHDRGESALLDTINKRHSDSYLASNHSHWRGIDTWGSSGGDLYATSMVLLAQ